MPVDREELELVWPPDLFAREGERILSAHGSPEHRYQRLDALMAEAFHGDRGTKLLTEVHQQRPPVPPDASVPGPGHDIIEIWESPPPYGTSGGALALMRELVDSADTLTVWAPRTYYSRRSTPSAETPLTDPEFRSELTMLLFDLVRDGYFDDAFGSTCEDDDSDPNRVGQNYLQDELDLPSGLRVWPPLAFNESTHNVVEVNATWRPDWILDAIEALYLVVARPRRRWWHDFGKHYDHDEFSRASGREVYAWRINSLLARAGLPLRLVRGGEEDGHLVRITEDGRDDLVASVQSTPDEADRDEVRHAIAMFRDRNGTREDRRSAVVSLARVLEARRKVIKDELLNKDEGALFEIANRFDIRHREAKQMSDYDEAYLDWVFWWYLATVELTDRILAQQADGGADDSH